MDTIESEFPRTSFPLVWEGLLVIHRAQEESIRLQRPQVSPYEVDVLGISFAKGGASVLADGYLVAKDVSCEQAQFLYGLGCYMQLADDLQDVIDDRKAGILTVFSQTATRWPLDGITNRLLTFGAGVAQGMFYFPTGCATFSRVVGWQFAFVGDQCSGRCRTIVFARVRGGPGETFSLPFRGFARAKTAFGPPLAAGAEDSGSIRLT